MPGCHPNQEKCLSQGCTGCQLMVNVDSCPGSVAPPNVTAAVGVPTLRWTAGPEETGEIDVEFI